MIADKLVQVTGYLAVSAALLGSAYLLRPMTPTDRCSDLAETVERRLAAKDDAFRLMAASPRASTYAACINAALANGGGAR